MVKYRYRTHEPLGIQWGIQYRVLQYRYRYVSSTAWYGADEQHEESFTDIYRHANIAKLDIYYRYLPITNQPPIYIYLSPAMDTKTKVGIAVDTCIHCIAYH